MYVHEAIAAELKRRGISPLFGLIGDANLYMVDAFTRGGGRYVAAAHEASAMLMALGHARATGGTGVATITHGPALTNAITGLVHGARARIPAVLVTGDTAVQARGHLQKIDQRELARDSGAGFVQLRAPNTVGEDLALAFRMARTNQCPVVFNMPADFQWLECVLNPVEDREFDAPVMTSGGTQFDNAIGIIAAARAPIVLAGRGAIGPAHREAMIALAERIGAPLATTLQARDLFAGEAFNLGIFGTLSTDPAVEAIAACDCVVVFGASLTRFTTIDGSLLKNKRVIQIDPERGVIGRNVRPDAGLAGDPELMARLIIQWLDEAEIPPSGFRTPELAEKLAVWRPAPVFHKSVPAGTVDLRETLLALNDALPQDRIVVTDGGRFLGEAWKLFSVRRPLDFVSPIGFAAIGTGMSEAIGASFADSARPTVLISGDGGFMLGGINEFFTAVREGVDLVAIICNDNGYGAEHVQFRNRDMNPALSMLHWPDFAPVADALGGKGVTIAHRDHVPAAIEAIRHRRGPLLIDIKLDADHVPQLPF